MCADDNRKFCVTGKETTEIRKLEERLVNKEHQITYMRSVIAELEKELEAIKQIGAGI